jgi:hypothetical protein
MSNSSDVSIFEFLADGFIDPREISKGGPDASEVHVMGSGGAPRAKTLAPLTRRSRKITPNIVKSGVSLQPVPTSELTTKEAKRRHKVNTFGIAGNVVATTGGAHALYLASKNKNLPVPEKVRGAVSSAASKMPKISNEKKEKAAIALKKIPGAKWVAENPKRAAAGAALGWVGLHGVELAADVVANRALVRERQQLKQKINKSDDVQDVTWTAEISKVDEEKRQVFGWCSLSKVNGEPVVDRQNDFVPLDEIEKSAYKYVLESRKGGDMHKRQMKKGLMGVEDEPVHTADLIESFVVTPEKLKQMGLEEDALPHGWWVGFKVNDEDQWQMVKSGKRTGFSIHGSGKRTPGVI